MPSQLDNEDALAISRNVYLLDLYRALKKQQSGQELSDTERIMIGNALQMELDNGS